MLALVPLLGLSLIAGFIGTLFMTVSQEIELRFINKRPVSFTPVIALFKILRFDFEKLATRTKVTLSYLVHFAYGTVWGFPLALFYSYGYTDPVLVGAAYFLIVLLQGWTTLWVLGITGPPWTWEYKAILSEIAHKTIYTAFVVISFSLLVS